MLYEPEIVIAHAKRAGIDLERSVRGTVLVYTHMHKVPDEWVSLLKRHKARILPLLPLRIEEEEKAKARPQTRYGLRIIPERGNYDMFDGVTPLCLKPRRRKAPPSAAWPSTERRKAVAHEPECVTCNSQ
jgi:hypothetical protein